MNFPRTKTIYLCPLQIVIKGCIKVIITNDGRRDNEDVVEECGRMNEENEALKVNLKEADEVMQAFEEKKEQDFE